MSEETVNMIEETDEIKNWICYAGERETSDLNTFTSEVTDQESLYIDPSSLVVNEYEQTFNCNSDDDNIKYMESEQHDQDNGDQMEEQTQQSLDNNDDKSKHNLILREIINENGHLEEEYLCQQCDVHFDTIEDFLSYHPSVELLNDNPEEEQPEEIVPTVSEDKLWDLVENLDESEDYVDEIIEDVIEIKPNVTQDVESLQDAAIELDNERYFCYDCKQVFADLITAENHDCINEMPTDNNDNDVYRCYSCDKDYTSLRSFNNHQRWHKKCVNVGQTKPLHAEPSICEICNTVFGSQKNLKLHMKMHKKHAAKSIQDALPAGAQDEYNELNKFFCEICNKSFDQKLLLIHKNMHQNLEAYRCGKCNKQFENLPSYEIHMQMHTDNSANVKKVNNLKKINNITNDTPSTSAEGLIDGSKRKHACQYCGKEFQRPYEKVKHERIHTGEKPYECEVCGKTFRVSYSLTLHLRTHTDIRPYVCPTCNKRFKQQSVYVHHLKTHEVERGYKCDVCGKSFRTSVQLGGHKNIHSKPYNCTECNRPFASLYAVKIHMKTHNKCHKSNKSLKNCCSICGASYARLFALRYHMKEQHGIDIDATKLYASAGTNESSHNEIDVETALLVNVAHEASNQEINFINVADEENYEEDEVDDELFGSQVDHEENVENPLSNNVYLDETEAATQTILNTDEMSVDNFSTEEIINE